MNFDKKLKSGSWILIITLLNGCSVIQPAPGTVTGVVRGVKTYDSSKVGPPLAGHEITLLNSSDGNIEARTTSDPNGRFTFSVPAGKYSLWAGERAEYVKVSAGEITTANLTAPQD